MLKTLQTRRRAAMAVGRITSTNEPYWENNIEKAEAYRPSTVGTGNEWSNSYCEIYIRMLVYCLVRFLKIVNLTRVRFCDVYAHLPLANEHRPASQSDRRKIVQFGLDVRLDVSHCGSDRCVA